jgi:hypothetical protein
VEEEEEADERGTNERSNLTRRGTLSRGRGSRADRTGARAGEHHRGKWCGGGYSTWTKAPHAHGCKDTHAEFHHHIRRGAGTNSNATRRTRRGRQKVKD